MTKAKTEDIRNYIGRRRFLTVIKHKTTIALVCVASLVGCEASLEDLPPVEQCFELHKTQFNDPQSAYIVEEHSYAGLDSIKVEYRAKNAFGGFVRGELECEAEDGELAGEDKRLLELKIADQEMEARLEAISN